MPGKFSGFKLFFMYSIFPHRVTYINMNSPFSQTKQKSLRKRNVRWREGKMMVVTYIYIRLSRHFSEELYLLRLRLYLGLTIDLFIRGLSVLQVLIFSQFICGSEPFVWFRAPFLNALHHHAHIWKPDIYFIKHGTFKVSSLLFYFQIG